MALCEHTPETSGFLQGFCPARSEPELQISHEESGVGLDQNIQFLVGESVLVVLFQTTGSDGSGSEPVLLVLWNSGSGGSVEGLGSGRSELLRYDR